MAFATVAPEPYRLLVELGAALHGSAVPPATRELVAIRASQINGCAFCLDMHVRSARTAGATEDQLTLLAGWRDAPVFSDAERAALDLTEAATRLADRPDPISDEIWDRAAAHYDTRALADLLVFIAKINAWNRLMIATRAVPRHAGRRQLFAVGAAVPSPVPTSR
jgi:AhpD family alkylhydroperoxidase